MRFFAKGSGFPSLVLVLGAAACGSESHSGGATYSPEQPPRGCADGPAPGCEPPAEVSAVGQNETVVSGHLGSSEVDTCKFKSFSEGLVGGQIGDVIYDDRVSGRAWASAGQRVFRSDDSGATWNLVSDTATFTINRIAIPPGDPSVLIAASTLGVVRSSDAGATWTVQGLSGVSVSSIVVHPAEPKRVYAGVRGFGVVRSNDGGLTWNPTMSPLPFGEVWSLAADPANADTILAIVVEQDNLGAGQGSDIFRTTNGGTTWTKVQELPKSLVRELAVCPADPSIVYAASANYYNGVSGVLRSNDRGLTWDTPAGLKGKLVTDVAVSATDCNDIYAVHYGTALKHSTDGGATFSGPLTDGIPFVNNFPRHVAVDPTNSARFLGASGGGLLFSSDAGAHFSLVGGVMNMAVRSLVESPTKPGELWLATWGSGIWRRSETTDGWQRANVVVDYAFNASPDPYVPGRVFIGTWSYPFVSTDDGATFTKLSVPWNITGFAFDATSASNVWMTTQIKGLFKSTDGGTNFAAANGTLASWPTAAGNFIDTRSVVVDRTAPTRLLIGTNGRGIYRTEDSGATLEPVAPSLSAALVSCLVQALDGAFYACVGGSGIAKSTDNGATFSYVNTGLPSLNVNTVIAEGNTLYASSNLGVSKSDDGASTWSPLDTGCLPDGAGMMSFVGTGAERKLVVGTGRGVFVTKP